MITGIVSEEFHLTPAEFERAVRRARCEFEAISIGDGDTVALLLRNGVAFLVAMTALGRSGIYAATLNWQSHSEELAHVLNDCGARAVLVDDELLDEFLEAIPPTVTVYVVGQNNDKLLSSSSTARSRPLLDWSQRAASRPEAETEARSPKGVIVYTSGTTGKPKGVRRLPYFYAQILIHILRKAGNNLTRENINNIALNLRDVELGSLLPSVTITTAPTQRHLIQKQLLTRFDGEKFVLLEP